MKQAEHSVQSRADWVTSEWWFCLPFCLGVALLPPIITKPPPMEEWLQIGKLYIDPFVNPLWPPSSPIWAAFEILPIVLVLALIFAGNRVSRVLSIYAAVTYVLFVVFQSVSVTERHGVAIMTCNVVWWLTVAGFWAWEAAAGFNDFSHRPRPIWKYWVVPFAIFAFWLPITYSRADGSFHFGAVVFLTKYHTGLAYCLMTPVYLAILTLYHPRVNLALMRVSALAGTCLGVLNMEVAFMTRSWFHAVIHVSLLVISPYALVLSFQQPRPKPTEGSVCPEST